MTHRIGQKGSLALAAVLYAGAFLLYAVWPGIPTLIVLLILLGVSDSYGLPAQSTYYTDMKEVQRYGYDKAMGVYSLFENIRIVHLWYYLCKWSHMGTYDRRSRDPCGGSDLRYLW